MRKLLLASQSPRRKELLEKAGFRFLTCSVNLSESLEKNLTLEEALLDLARRKIQAVVDAPNLLKAQDNLILGADTVVVLDDQILGKPQDFDQAVQFLRALSGRAHRVMTAVAFFDQPTKVWDGAVGTSWVHFRPLTEGEIQEYVQTREPMDKAGAYGIQGEASRFVERLEGDLDNVIGLPMRVVQQLLSRNNWHVD